MNLTERQQDVARLVAKGKQNKDIAAELGISVRRVEQIITRIAQVWQLDADLSYRVQIANRAA